jgi:hypothetical protein
MAIFNAQIQSAADVTLTVNRGLFGLTGPNFK